ncbi:MAG TPA: hypothetical protein PKI05_11310, partial [Thermogutta sp.]|nr:hypothetical protein [Thermogutta sp.]
MPEKSNLPKKPTSEKVFVTVSLFQGFILDLRVLYSLDGRVYLACLQQHLSPTRMFKHTVPVGVFGRMQLGFSVTVSSCLRVIREPPHVITEMVLATEEERIVSQTKLIA